MEFELELINHDEQKKKCYLFSVESFFFFEQVKIIFSKIYCYIIAAKQ